MSSSASILATDATQHRNALDKLESYWKSVNILITGVGTVAGAFLGLVAILSDIYSFFWSLVAVTAIAGAIVLYLFTRNYHPSELAPESDVRVERFGKPVRFTSLVVFSTLFAGVIIMLFFFFPSIFDPVTINSNESAISVEALNKVPIQVSRTVAVLNGQTIDAVILRMSEGEKENRSAPYTLSFDVMKKDRYKWAKIEKIAVNVLAVEPVPEGTRFEGQLMTMFRPAMEFKVIVPKGTTATHPNTHNATLIDTTNAVTQRGSILVEDGKPVTFVIDVYFEQVGVYEIVPEITVNDGWRRKTFLATKPVKVVCGAGEGIEREVHDFLPPRKPIKMPEKKKEPND